MDGLRGISAIYVMFYHAQLFTGHTNDYLKSTLKPLNIFLSFGHFSVAIFIVLSGFCLTIPIATSERKELRGGFKRYISRRFTRIIPPYYAALLIFLVFIFSVPIMQTIQNTAWDSKIPVTLGSIISHIFLVHNFSREWILKIDGPMWSVATEWQIYFIFPLLLWVWRKYGLLTSFILANIIGVAVALKLSLIHPWYLGLFAMGMVGAIICFSKELVYVNLRSKLNWSKASKISTLLIFALMIFISFRTTRDIISETLTGFFITVIIINFTLIEINNYKRPLFLKLCNSKTAIFLGAFSYSIYLIHSPILGYLNLMSLKYNMDIDLRLGIMFILFIPIALLISYLFHIVIEKRFMPGKRKG
ncbi:acyltransferase family protein [Pedobacter sp. P26]|uniref:acyltransferase family protein n=1 Tax=Pedobacter sp. P26 TaxID=3423956 RepID=UPI003D66E590